MKASRFAGSVLIIGAILALYRTLLPVNNTTVVLTLLLAILGMSAGWGLAEATVASLVAVAGLDREDADFLGEAATFNRAVNHGQRVSTGHAEGSLPTSPAQFEVLTVKRWTPEHLHEQRPDVTLREIRRRTREFFKRLFGSA